MFPLSKPPSLVLFDCDGVLVDSEPISGPILRDHLEAHGLVLTMEELDTRFKGRTMPDIRADIHARHGIVLDEAWQKAYRAATDAAFEEQLEPIPHIHMAVSAILGAKVPVCVASSGPVEKMTVTLGITGLMPFFEGLLFSGWDVPRGKPQPDIFLYAAKGMGVAPEGCVVIEDSAHGIAAAQAAGMGTLAYVPEADAGRLVDSDGLGAHPFHDMRSLPGLLGL